MTPEEHRLIASKLGDPALSLPLFGRILDQRTGTDIKYDPHAITERLQATLLSYVSDPLRTEYDQTRWLVLLGYRQAGKSLTAELCGYAKTAYSPGWDHVCIADRRDRADYLHKRVHFTHHRWPDEVRTPTIAARESRQLTFDSRYGGRMRVLSGESGAVGIGQSPDFFHGSEMPFHTDAGGQFSMIYPSIINRNEVNVILESTPAARNAPSVQWWQDTCADAKLGRGRWLYAFFPFWDGKLNSRPWHKDWSLENEEIRLLERYGPKGLCKEHLAFRRLLIETDEEIRRNPDLFGVYYPFDDSSCWLAAAGGVIHKSLLERHLNGTLVDRTSSYMEYENPEPGAIYCMGVDPVGYAARDHAAFQVLKVYNGEWTQVATYADHTDPTMFAKQIRSIAERFNNANVAIESNGVGQAIIALLLESGYKNVYYESMGKPGINTNRKSLSQMMGWMSDALIDELVLRDSDTVNQLMTYRADKNIEDGLVQEQLRGGKVGKGRRDRHHWDLVSALMIAVNASRNMPRRTKPGEVRSILGENVIPFKNMSFKKIQDYWAEEGKDKTPKKRNRYRSVRKRRRR